MNKINTLGIVLKRTNYQEADRILRVLTPDKGKISLIAKGVRKPKSKLAGGIELFCTSDISYIQGKSDLSTLVSSRVNNNFKHIVTDLDRTMFAYDAIARVDQTCEQSAGEEFYDVLLETLASLNNFDISKRLVELWFMANFLTVSGMMPNVSVDQSGAKLEKEKAYDFNLDNMTFEPKSGGQYSQNDIKFARLVNSSKPGKLNTVIDVESVLTSIYELYKTIYRYSYS